MRTKVSDLRLGDCLAEHPIIGSVIKLELDGDHKSRILFVNESDVLHRDPFVDAEIRTLDDFIETLDVELYPIRARLIKTASDIENCETMLDRGLKMRTAVELHGQLGMLKDEYLAARVGAVRAWPQFMKDLLVRNLERLLHDIFEFDANTDALAASMD